MPRPLPALASLLALALAACAGRGGLGYMGSREVPSRDELELLADYPSPGANASDEIHDVRGEVIPRPADLAFADEVVAYEPGVPAPIPEGQDARAALGPPDYTPDIHTLPRAVSLGNGGSITLGFTKGVLVDGPGPDVFVFEIGPSVEAVLVDVSADGKAWIAVGEARGGACAIDIGPHVSPSDVFRFVRLRDVPHQGAESDAWPGADIDAVGVRAAPQRVALPNEVLFEFDSDALASGASAALGRVVAAIEARPRARVTVEGHTDDVGSAEYNQKLSERRAEAVASYLAQKGVERGRITARGLGARRPVAPNDSDENRGKNRRVEIVIEEP